MWVSGGKKSRGRPGVAGLGGRLARAAAAEIPGHDGGGNFRAGQVLSIAPDAARQLDCADVCAGAWANIGSSARFGAVDSREDDDRVWDAPVAAVRGVDRFDLSAGVGDDAGGGVAGGMGGGVSGVSAA